MVVLLVKGYSQKIHEGNNSDLGRHSLLFALPNLCTVISPGVKQSMSLSRFGSAITRTAPRIVAPMPKRHLALPAKDIPAMYDKTTAEIWLADPGECSSCHFESTILYLFTNPSACGRQVSIQSSLSFRALVFSAPPTTRTTS